MTVIRKCGTVAPFNLAACSNLFPGIEDAQWRSWNIRHLFRADTTGNRASFVTQAEEAKGEPLAFLPSFFPSRRLHTRDIVQLVYQTKPVARHAGHLCTPPSKYSNLPILPRFNQPKLRHTLSCRVHFGGCDMDAVLLGETLEGGAVDDNDYDGGVIRWMSTRRNLCACQVP
ncbi:hypothetical protein CPC08DRAFT_810980 [Agrocybe pediades]|nr:hypothetical protein CPC08DRAFT_810980 [Agrocybe pediades]